MREQFSFLPSPIRFKPVTWAGLKSMLLKSYSSSPSLLAFTILVTMPELLSEMACERSCWLHIMLLHPLI